ncbi:MAG: type IV pilus twitching motility protein PilT [Aquaspirillum sp.]
MLLSELLAFAYQHKASDIHLVSGSVPILRIGGVLHPLDMPIVTAEALLTILNREPAIAPYLSALGEHEQDFALSFPELGRVRFNIFLQQHGVSCAMRLLPKQLPTLADLGVPDALLACCVRQQGLILVTGATGSGKSTTLAALVQYINHTQPRHIVTLEDPIEWIHSAKYALIQQREIGRHSPSFAHALRAALRQDPDVLLIGELRDLEVMRLALTAAETGHLVLATLHTGSAVSAVDRLLDSFPAAERDMAAAILADTLLAVVAQTLLPTVVEGQRRAVFELLLSTPAVKNLIRERNSAQLLSVLQTGQAQGMQTLMQDTQRLYDAGVIERTAWLSVKNKL